MTFRATRSPRVDKWEEMTEGSHGMDPLLYRLLWLATEHGLEKYVVEQFPFKNSGIQDKIGNFIITIGPKTPETIFSSHMDTMHSVREEHLKTKKKCHIWLVHPNDKSSPDAKGFVRGAFKRPPVKGSNDPVFEHCVLGADDKVGVWIMCKMIEAKIPGRYVFHVGEEKGCIGSSWLTLNTPEVAKGIKRCVAFDRMGYADIIAFQRGRRTASTEFTNALAEAINANLGIPDYTHQYKGDVHGSYTDSANYDDLVPECTNISVGYFGQHGSEEILDFHWLQNYLLPAVLKIDWNALPTARNPKRLERETWTNNYGANHKSSAYYGSETYAEKRVTFRNVTEFTALNLVPKWEPGDGINVECSARAMIRVIHGWISPSKNEEIAKSWYNLMLLRDALQLRLKASQEANHKLRLQLALAKLGKPSNDVIIDVDAEEVSSDLDSQEGHNTEILGPVLPLEVSGPASNIFSGEPKDPEEFKRRSAQKCSILSVIFSIDHKPTFTSMTDDFKFKRLGKKFFQIWGTAKKENPVNLSRKNYKHANKLLSQVVEILYKTQLNTENSDEPFRNAYKAALDYTGKYNNEPGINVNLQD